MSVRDNVGAGQYEYGTDSNNVPQDCEKASVRDILKFGVPRHKIQKGLGAGPI